MKISTKKLRQIIREELDIMSRETSSQAQISEGRGRDILGVITGAARDLMSMDAPIVRMGTAMFRSGAFDQTTPWSTGWEMGKVFWEYGFDSPPDIAGLIRNLGPALSNASDDIQELVSSVPRSNLISMANSLAGYVNSDEDGNFPWKDDTFVRGAPLIFRALQDAVVGAGISVT